LDASIIIRENGTGTKSSLGHSGAGRPSARLQNLKNKKLAVISIN
jgi:hypothetical protein